MVAFKGVQHVFYVFIRFQMKLKPQNNYIGPDPYCQKEGKE